MQKKKTGDSYLVFVVRCVAIIKRVGILKKRKKLKEIGINIGLLFQLVDDLIDYKGDSKTSSENQPKVMRKKVKQHF